MQFSSAHAADAIPVPPFYDVSFFWGIAREQRTRSDISVQDRSFDFYSSGHFSFKSRKPHRIATWSLILSAWSTYKPELCRLCKFCWNLQGIFLWRNLFESSIWGCPKMEFPLSWISIRNSFTWICFGALILCHINRICSSGRTSLGEKTISASPLADIALDLESKLRNEDLITADLPWRASCSDTQCYCPVIPEYVQLQVSQNNVFFSWGLVFGASNSDLCRDTGHCYSLHTGSVSELHMIQILDQIIPLEQEIWIVLHQCNATYVILAQVRIQQACPIKESSTTASRITGMPEGLGRPF